jgi:hypothetical protein
LPVARRRRRRAAVTAALPSAMFGICDRKSPAGCVNQLTQPGVFFVRVVRAGDSSGSAVSLSCREPLKGQRGAGGKLS